MKFRTMLTLTLDKHSGSAMYILKFDLPVCKVEEMQRFGAITILDSSSYENFRVHIKHMYRGTLQ